MAFILYIYLNFSSLRRVKFFLPVPPIRFKPTFDSLKWVSKIQALQWGGGWAHTHTNPSPNLFFFVLFAPTEGSLG